MDIEEVAIRFPEKIHKVFIDPMAGLTTHEAEDTVFRVGLTGPAAKEAGALLQSLYRAYDETDASLVEVNPFILTVVLCQVEKKPV